MLVLISSFIFISCKKASDQATVSITTPAPTQAVAAAPTSEPAVKDQGNQTQDDSDENNTADISDSTSSSNFSYDISEASYFSDDIIKIYYPQLTHMTYKTSQDSNAIQDSKEHLDRINELISKAAMRYADGFDTAQTDNVLENDYIIRWKGSKLLSIQFIGYKNVTTAAYPSSFSYTLNIDLNTAGQVKLSDLFQVDDDLLAAIQEKGSSSYLYFDKNRQLTEDSSFGQPDILKTIKDYVFGKDYSSGLTDADTEDSPVHSYFTEDSFGISFDTVHALGDHIQFEVKYSDILENRKSDNSIWSDFSEELQNSVTPVADTDAPEEQESFLLDENLIWKNINYVPGFSVMKDQSFPVDFENWGEVYFVSGIGEGEFSRDNLYLYLADKNSNILYEFPSFYGNIWVFSSLAAVSFQDVNSDGLKDVVVVAYYLTGTGPTGAEEFPVADVYFQTADGFISLPDVVDEINFSGRNDSIVTVVDYVKGLDITLE
jgi:hypothetical protein